MLPQNTKAEFGFIVGHYKSGSTWLINLLSLHPDVRGVSESHVFRLSREFPNVAEVTDCLWTKTAWGGIGSGSWLRHRISDGFRGFWRSSRRGLAPEERPHCVYDLSRRQRQELKRRLLSAPSPDAYCQQYFDFLIEALVPRRYLIEKTPTNIHEVPRIRRLFPQAKLIAIYRDGRDVVASDQSMHRWLKSDRFDFETSVRNWRDAMEAQLNYQRDYEIHTLAYEELLTAPERSISRLLEFLELPADSGIISDMIRRSSFEFTTGRHNGQEARGGDFYRKGIAGDWVNQFSEVDCNGFIEVAGEMLAGLGYDLPSEHVVPRTIPIHKG